MTNSSKITDDDKLEMRALLSRDSRRFPARAEVIALCRKYGYYSDSTAQMLIAGSVPGYDYSKDAKVEAKEEGET